MSPGPMPLEAIRVLDVATVEVFGELGLDAADLERLRGEGVI